MSKSTRDLKRIYRKRWTMARSFREFVCVYMFNNPAFQESALLWMRRKGISLDGSLKQRNN